MSWWTSPIDSRLIVVPTPVGPPVLLEVGRILKPHGLKGHVVVELWSNRGERVEVGSALQCSGRRLDVVSASLLPGRPSGSRWLVAFAGVCSVEHAEALRGELLLAEPIRDEGVLWVHEMVGAQLYDREGVVVGEITAVQANPASDLLVLADGRLVPLTFVVKEADGTFRVDGPAGLLDS